MDESEQVPGDKNDGSKGVSWLGPASSDDTEEDMEKDYVLLGCYDVDSFPKDHPYRRTFYPKTTDGTIAVRNPDDLRLIAAAPELLAPLDRLATAAANRDNTMGDPCRLIECKGELANAVKQARAVIDKATKGE